jgi:hypothetical protein
MPFANSAQTHATLDVLSAAGCADFYLRYLRAPHNGISCISQPETVQSSLRRLDWRFHHVEVAESRAGETIIRTANRQSRNSRRLHLSVRLHPRVVVILGGINDIDESRCPRSNRISHPWRKPRNNMEHMLCSSLYSPQASRILIIHPRRTLLVRTTASLATTESCSATTNPNTEQLAQKFRESKALHACWLSLRAGR